MSGGETLREAQERFARVASALEDAAPDEISLDAWLRADRGVDAAERMAIYSHAYFARIHTALRDDFGALAAALGEAGFHDLVKLYLMAHPPHHFSLRYAGAKLPQFLASEAAEPFRVRWPFAPDLAALEWALTDLFDASDSPVLGRESLAAVPQERWGGLRFRLGDAHRVLALSWPVGELREAWSAEQPLPALALRPTRVLVYRREERVFQRALPALEARALELVRAGADLEALCGTVADEIGDAGAVEHAVSLLDRWLAEHLLAALEDPGPA